MLFISRIAMCRRTLPIPERSRLPPEALSSETIFWVRRRDLGRELGVMAPALRLRSDKKDSLSEANFNNALSKSKFPASSRNEEFRGEVGPPAPPLFPPLLAPLIVMLLRLLLEPLAFGSESPERNDKRWTEVRFSVDEPGLERLSRRGSWASSASASSSIVSAMAGPGEVALLALYSSPKR